MNDTSARVIYMLRARVKNEAAHGDDEDREGRPRRHYQLTNEGLDMVRYFEDAKALMEVCA